MTKRSAFIRKEQCVACGNCVRVCPKNAVGIWKGLYALVDTAACIGCGKCQKNCPASIISMKEEKDK